MSEIQKPILVELSSLLSAKRGIICQSVHSEFKELVAMCGGPNEKSRANHLLKHIMWVHQNKVLLFFNLLSLIHIHFETCTNFGFITFSFINPNRKQYSGSIQDCYMLELNKCLMEVIMCSSVKEKKKVLELCYLEGREDFFPSKSLDAKCPLLACHHVYEWKPFPLIPSHHVTITFNAFHT